MKKAPFLLAYRERKIDSKDRAENGLIELDEGDPEEQSFVKEWHLQSAAQIVIINDLIPYALFRAHLTAAPQEDAIEELYQLLGAPNVSDLVEEEPRLGPAIRDQRTAEHLKELIIERSRLFLHEQHPSAVVHDAKWLEKNLVVQTVQSVSLRRTLRNYGQSHLERRSAARHTRGKLTKLCDVIIVYPGKVICYCHRRNGRDYWGDGLRQERRKHPMWPINFIPLRTSIILIVISITTWHV